MLVKSRQISSYIFIALLSTKAIAKQNEAIDVTELMRSVDKLNFPAVQLDFRQLLHDLLEQKDLVSDIALQHPKKGKPGYR